MSGASDLFSVRLSQTSFRLHTQLLAARASSTSRSDLKHSTNCAKFNLRHFNNHIMVDFMYRLEVRPSAPNLLLGLVPLYLFEWRVTDVQ